MYAGTSGAAAASYFSSGDKNSMAKRFEGISPRSNRPFKSGGASLIGTLGREGSDQPLNGLFAVVAFNTNATYTQGSALLPEQQIGTGQTVSLSSLYMHEGNENISFAAQRAFGFPLDRYAYTKIAHPYAVKEELRSRKSGDISGFAGAFLISQFKR